MSKLDNALYEIHHMDTLATRNQWLNRIHPLVKLLITIIYITVTVSFHKYDLSGVLRMGIYPIILFIIGDISFKDSIRRLRIILPLVCLVGIFNPFFDHQPLLQLGSVAVSGGVVSMLTLMIKGIYTVLAAYLLIATTSIDNICYSLRLLHIPVIIVTMVMLTYRYISLLLSEANRVTRAYELRAPGQKGIHFKVWGSLAGQMLLRSMDRASEVYESMCLRGYQGNFTYERSMDFHRKDVLYFIIVIAILGILRFI